LPCHTPKKNELIFLRFLLLNFLVSVRGALGSEAQTFIRQISARMAGAVLLGCEEASWAPQAVFPSSALRSPSSSLWSCNLFLSFFLPPCTVAVL